MERVCYFVVKGVWSSSGGGPIKPADREKGEKKLCQVLGHGGENRRV